MKHAKKFLFFAVFIASLIAFTGPVRAGNPFRNVTSTVDGYPTWDSDMINVADFEGDDAVDYTGNGVYVAVLDTGLVPNWRDYFPEERIATELGTGFYEELKWDPKINDFVETTGELHKTSYIGSVGSSHGTHVTSTIIGYYYRANADLFSGFNLPPIMVRGIAPDVTIIPVKVLADYQQPGFGTVVFGTDQMVAAGINYIADLAPQLDGPVIISMSLGGDVPDESGETEAAIDYAISQGVIVVASAGNDGTEGMGWPGAYPQVISVGATGWTKEWLVPGDGPFFRMWWLQSDLLPYEDIPESTPIEEVYVTNFSSRENDDRVPGYDQELDVLAPGSWVRGPFPGFPGYSHLPWWSGGIADMVGPNPGNFYYVGGTSMAAPHVSAVAAMMLEKEPSLVQSDVENYLKSTALSIPPGSADVFFVGFQAWGTDATGSGLIQADAALAAIP